MSENIQWARSAMHRAATHFAGAAKDWRDAEGQLNYANLAPDDLGIIGRMANVPQQYNASVHEVWAKLDKGATGLDGVANTLEIISEVYRKTEQSNVREILAKKKDFKGVPPAAD